MVVQIIKVTMIIKTSLGETGIGSINGHHIAILDVVHLTIMKAFHNYLTKSLLSQTPCNNYDIIL